MKTQLRRRRLPHVDQPGSIYFVTTCLAGSISANGIKDIAHYRQGLSRKERPHGMTVTEWHRRKWKLEFGRTDHWLDQQPAVRHLKAIELAAEVERAMLHFAGERYTLWSWVVMPSHIHWVFESNPVWIESLGESVDQRTPRERIMHSIKRHSSRQCNQLRGESGTFWQDESYDHCVNDIEELERIIEYIELNPVKVCLSESASDFRFSSAFYRKFHRIPCGRPLIGESGICT